MSPTDLSDVPHAPPRRHLSFYAVLLAAVLPIWGLVPLSWVVVINALYSGKLWSLALEGRIFFFVALCEVLFSVYQYKLMQKISRPSSIHFGDIAHLRESFQRVLRAGLASLPEYDGDVESIDPCRPGSPEEIIEKLAHDDPRAIDFRLSLRTWFRHVPWSSLRREQVYEWLHWSIFNASYTSYDDIEPNRRAILDEALDLIEKRTGVSIPHGSSPDIRPILLTLDPINRWYEKFWDLKCGNYNGLEYLIRIPSNYNRDTDPEPCIIVHGLGLGVLQYQLLISNLVDELQDRPILILLQPHISQDIFHPRFLEPMGKEETVGNLAGLLQKLHWVDSVHKGVTFFSHSNGSYVHCWMLKTHPEMVSRSCFVDPVVFCSWEGDICYNFIYRPCTNGVELVMRYFVGTELGVANLLQRRFDWANNSLWYEEIPNAQNPERTLIFVGGKDAIVRADRVLQYLKSHGVREGIHFDPEGRHGQALVAGGQSFKKMIRWLKQTPASTGIEPASASECNTEKYEEET